MGEGFLWDAGEEDSRILQKASYHKLFSGECRGEHNLLWGG